MILDSSAVISLIRQEQHHKRLHRALERANVLAIGSPTLFETTMVLIGLFGNAGRGVAAQFLEDWEVEVVPFEERHWRIAASAFARFGKGRHPASLNYGDCMTYASARLAEMPLLFVGNDFSQTDIDAAI